MKLPAATKRSHYSVLSAVGDKQQTTFFRLPNDAVLPKPPSASSIVTDCRLQFERPDGARHTLTLPKPDLISITWLHSLPYAPDYPVVCFDERPCFLIGELVDPPPCRDGQVRKERYAYEKNGACALLSIIVPLTGKRLAQIQPQRAKKEYTLFCQTMAAAWPEGKKIRLVQDNLNTHNASSFYENLPAAEAFALAERFEFYYTPKSDGWLNMIEAEFSAIARQCLNRRIPTNELMEKGFGAYQRTR